jgi:hypothetical protein
MGFGIRFRNRMDKNGRNGIHGKLPSFKLVLALVIGVGFRNGFTATENGFKGTRELFFG